MDATKTSDKYQLTDEQFNEIRIMAGKIHAMGDFLCWTAPDDFYPHLIEELNKNLGDIVRDSAFKLNKLMNEVETSHIAGKKALKSREEVSP